MRRFTALLMCSVCLLMAASSTLATTVLFDVRAVVDGQPVTDPQEDIVVAPGDEVAYQVTVLVTSAPIDPNNPVPRTADGEDNLGLSFFRLDVLTTLGVNQAPADAFVSPIDQAFTVQASLGSVFGDDITQIGGAQDVLTLGGIITPRVGQGAPQVLVEGSVITGQLDADQAEAQFTVQIGPGAQASIFSADSLFQSASAAVSIGDGFAIVVQEGTDGDDTDGDGTNGDGTDGDGTDGDGTDGDGTNGDESNTTPTTLPVSLPVISEPILTGTATLIGVAALTAGAMLLIGPLAGAIALVVALAALVLMLLGAGG